ncbi:hypothetical protein [Yersinia hibernica]|uniref:hypothetical protein n=1 Tax=Yersinia hibernica TaxID=2339259 RepID=UPI001FEB5D98|nr:hypothetical protein [Yersinia hibernica]
MSWYKAGSVTSVAGTNIITGTGTLWNNPIFGIAPGQMIFVPGAGQVVIYEILAVDSDTQIRIASSLDFSITDSDYAIVTTVSNSMSDLARRTAVQLALYQGLLQDWQNITTGIGDVTIIAPDGSEVIIPSLSQMSQDISNKVSQDDLTNGLSGKAGNGENADITALNALTKAIEITQGGTGKNTLAGAQSALGIVADAFGASGIANTPWLSLTTAGGWSTAVGYSLIYRKVLGMLQLKVTLFATSVATGSIVGTLPVGYRPTQVHIVTPFGQRDTSAGLYPMRFIVNTDGNISVTQFQGTGEVSGTFLIPLQ